MAKSVLKKFLFFYFSICQTGFQIKTTLSIFNFFLKLSLDYVKDLIKKMHKIFMKNLVKKKLKILRSFI